MGQYKPVCVCEVQRGQVCVRHCPGKTNMCSPPGSPSYWSTHILEHTHSTVSWHRTHTVCVKTVCVSPPRILWWWFGWMQACTVGWHRRLRWDRSNDVLTHTRATQLGPLLLFHIYANVVSLSRVDWEGLSVRSRWEDPGRGNGLNVPTVSLTSSVALTRQPCECRSRTANIAGRLWLHWAAPSMNVQNCVCT